MKTPTVKFINLNSVPLLNDDSRFSFIFEKKNYNFWNYKTLDNEVFRTNLILIDSHLPQIISKVILYSFLNNEASLQSIVDNLEIQDSDNTFFTYKIKQFLKHLAFGLSTSALYYGEPNIYDRYPVLKTKEGILYYGENMGLFLDSLLKLSTIKILDRTNRENKSDIMKLSFEISINTTK